MLFTMKINGVTSNPYHYMRTTKGTQTQDSFAAAMASSTEPPIWGELRGKYDIRNATIDEMSAISKELYQAGEISLKDHGLMLSLKWVENIKAQSNPGVSTGSSVRVDWIKEYEARIEFDRRMGNTLGQANNRTVLSIVKRLGR